MAGSEEIFDAGSRLQQAKPLVPSGRVLGPLYKNFKRVKRGVRELRKHPKR